MLDLLQSLQVVLSLLFPLCFLLLYNRYVVLLSQSSLFEYFLEAVLHLGWKLFGTRLG